MLCYSGSGSGMTITNGASFTASGEDAASGYWSTTASCSGGVWSETSGTASGSDDGWNQSSY